MNIQLPRRTEIRVQFCAKTSCGNPRRGRPLSVAQQYRRARAGQLWEFYLQLVQVEQAFALKGDLAIRPIFHQKRTGSRPIFSWRSWPIVCTRAWAAFEGFGTRTDPRVGAGKVGSDANDRRASADHRRTRSDLTRYTQPETEQRILLEKLKLTLPAQPPPKITAQTQATPATPLCSADLRYPAQAIPTGWHRQNGPIGEVGLKHGSCATRHSPSSCPSPGKLALASLHLLLARLRRDGRRDVVAIASMPPLPTASACGRGHLKLRTRQGEFAWERAGVRGCNVLRINDSGH